MRFEDMTIQQIKELVCKDLNLRLDFIASFSVHADIAHEIFDYPVSRLFLVREDALEYMKLDINLGQLVVVRKQDYIEVYRHEHSEESFMCYEIKEIENPLFGTKEFVKNSIKRKLLYANDRQIAKLVEQATKIDKDIIETRTRTEKNQQKLKQWFFKDKE